MAALPTIADLTARLSRFDLADRLVQAVIDEAGDLARGTGDRRRLEALATEAVRAMVGEAIAYRRR